MESTEQACDWLAPKVDTLFVAGLSMGALLSLQMAARKPRLVAGIALYSTTLWYDGWSLPLGSSLLPLILRLPFGKRYRYVEAFPYGIKNERIRKFIMAKMESGDSAAAGLRGTPGQSLAELLELIEGTKRQLPAVEAPTLIVHAAKDDVTSVRNADYVAKRLRSPVRRVLLEDSYHMITIDGERERVAALTAEFFDSVQASPSTASLAAAS
jgi:carboxylesterase